VPPRSRWGVAFRQRKRAAKPDRAVRVAPPGEAGRGFAQVGARSGAVLDPALAPIPPECLSHPSVSRKHSPPSPVAVTRLLNDPGLTLTASAAVGHGRNTKQVHVAWASSLPFASVRFPSARPTVLPTWMVLPVHVTRPVASVIGRTKPIDISSVEK
jgi:hypothetical protein